MFPNKPFPFRSIIFVPHFSFLCFHCSAAGGEIFNQCVADNDEAFTEKDVIRLAKQILTGVAFLHRNNVVHLDLKVRTRRDYVTIGNRFSALERSTEITFLLCNQSSFCTFWPLFPWRFNQQINSIVSRILYQALFKYPKYLKSKSYFDSLHLQKIHFLNYLRDFFYFLVCRDFGFFSCPNK